MHIIYVTSEGGGVKFVYAYWIGEIEGFVCSQGGGGGGRLFAHHRPNFHDPGSIK